MSIKSISIIKTGSPIRKKVVTSKDDMNKIISFIKTINLKSKLNEHYKGWTYSITIEDVDNNITSIEIYLNKISYNNIFYSIDTSVNQKLKEIYSELNYPEVNPI